MPSVLETNPSTQEQATSEDLVWQIDVSNWLTGTQVVSTVTSELVEVSSGSVIPLTDVPLITNAGKAVVQRIRGAELEPQKAYWLYGIFTVGGTTNSMTFRMRINVPW